MRIKPKTVSHLVFLLCFLAKRNEPNNPVKHSGVNVVSHCNGISNNSLILKRYQTTKDMSRR